MIEDDEKDPGRSYPGHPMDGMTDKERERYKAALLAAMTPEERAARERVLAMYPHLKTPGPLDE